MVSDGREGLEISDPLQGLASAPSSVGDELTTGLVIFSAGCCWGVASLGCESRPSLSSTTGDESVLVGFSSSPGQLPWLNGSLAVAG